MVSKLNIIDLAGSERVGETGAQGQRLSEACSINNSLSVLTEMIKHLAKSSNPAKKRDSSVGFPRYRESKLTHYLKDSLGGMIMVIACISLEDKFSDDSLRTI